MKISTKGRYALRIMIDLAENANGEYIRLKDISARQGITLKYMEQIMPMLTKAGYVRSYRGNNGGYMLAKEPEEYTAVQRKEALRRLRVWMTCRIAARDRISVPHLSSGKDLKK
jgi:Rrf2 family protein